MHAPGAVWSVVGLLALAACSGGGGGTYNAACDTLATARCDRNDACSGGFANTVLYGSINTCMTLQARHCSASHPVLDANESPSLIDDCAASLGEMTCDAFVDGPTAVACELPGTRSLGEGCYTNTQCQTAHCAVAAGTACGACTNPPTAGSPCTATTGFSCTGGALCDRAAGVCEAPGNVDAPCEDANTVVCGYGLGCTGEAGARTCQVLANLLGAPCDANSQSAPTCDASYGLACSAAARTCVAALRADVGQACGQGAGGEQVLCAPALACVRATTSSDQGLCTVRAPLGTSCTPQTATSDGLPCAYPGVCVRNAVGQTATCQEIISATCY